MKIGFAGLGQMGKPIAKNLVADGDEVLVYDRTNRFFDEMIASGARCTEVPLDLASADVIFLCLPNTEIVSSFLIGDSGLSSHLKSDQTVVDLSTIDYGATVNIARNLATRNVNFIDAPISGMEARAVDRTLTVMCGGPEGTFEQVKKYFERIGNKILYMGPAGSGQLTKLINQLLFDINAAAIAEILPMAVKLGLNPDLVGEVVNSGTGRSYASDFFIQRILRNHFSDGYPMGHAYKDLISGAKLGAELCIPMPVLSAATATYQAALLKGLKDQDKGAMIKVYESMLGVEFRTVAS